jgi:hypothetical protein
MLLESRGPMLSENRPVRDDAAESCEVHSLGRERLHVTRRMAALPAMMCGRERLERPFVAGQCAHVTVMRLPRKPIGHDGRAHAPKGRTHDQHREQRRYYATELSHIDASV